MAAPKKDEKEKLAPIIIKRVKKGGGGHHGGAWKVAYADFVTAMMAFFLLLWLLNVTTKEQKNAISDYFDPSHPKVSDTVSGSGGIMGGMTMSADGAMVSTVQPLTQAPQKVTQNRGSQTGNKTPDGEETQNDTEAEALAKLEEELRAKEDKRFQEAAEQLKAEIAKAPELKDLQNNILVDITPEGLRIQIVDDKGRSMFPSGSAVMYPFMTEILTKVSGVVKALPNQVSVRGHTDSVKYKAPNTYDNWNLSADRAQASRRVLVTGGLTEGRIENVMGRSDREPLEKDPAAARNRRISIILLRQKVSPEDLKKQKEEAAREAAQKTKDTPAGQPVTIVDDTVQGPPTPAPAADPKADGQSVPAAKAESGAPKAEFNQPQYTTPLPTVTVPETFKRQPQVMYFDNNRTVPKSAEDNAPLYEGPVVAPIRNKPPQIRTPVFELGEDEAARAVAPSPRAAQPENQPAAKATAPRATQPQKTLSFGEAVPPQAAPAQRAPLPTAPALQLDVAPKDANPATPQPEAAPQAPTVPAAPTAGKTLQF